MDLIKNAINELGIGIRSWSSLDLEYFHVRDYALYVMCNMRKSHTHISYNIYYAPAKYAYTKMRPKFYTYIFIHITYVMWNVRIFCPYLYGKIYYVNKLKLDSLRRHIWVSDNWAIIRKMVMIKFNYIWAEKSISLNLN